MASFASVGTKRLRFAAPERDGSSSRRKRLNATELPGSSAAIGAVLPAVDSRPLPSLVTCNPDTRSQSQSVQSNVGSNIDSIPHPDCHAHYISNTARMRRCADGAWGEWLRVPFDMRPMDKVALLTEAARTLFGETIVNRGLANWEVWFMRDYANDNAIIQPTTDNAIQLSGRRTVQEVLAREGVAGGCCVVVRSRAIALSSVITGIFAVDAVDGSNDKTTLTLVDHAGGIPSFTPESELMKNLPCVKHFTKCIIILPFAERTSKLVEAIVKGVKKVDLPSGAETWELEEGHRFPNLNSNKLYVRACYKELFEQGGYLNQCRGKNNVSVLGTSGIGKSSFGIYVFGRLVELSVPVIYMYPKCLGKGVALAVEDKKVVSDLESMTLAEDTVVIVDGIKSPFDFVRPRMTLMISSPIHATPEENFKDAMALYMPLPSLEEVMELRNTCFNTMDPALSPANVLQRISKWGPIPRHVLKNVWARFQHDLDACVKGQGLEHLIAIASGNDEKIAAAKIDHKVAHIVVQNFRKVRYDFASPYVARMVMDRAALREQEKFQDFIRESLACPELLRIFLP